MKRQLGVEGNTFAYAYVIAHEIGHHVENLTGTLGKAHQAMSQTDKVQANQISVRLELLADYYAGVWAHYEDAINHSMEYGDLEKGLELAKAIGDDWLQKKAQGRATPESFTHGTSDQRKRCLKRGFEIGDMRRSTFSVQNYNDLQVLTNSDKTVFEVAFGDGFIVFPLQKLLKIIVHYIAKMFH
jgi:predicted metalloprotease